jgi:uncharacterized protein YjiS (DUF1127 family)
MSNRLQPCTGPAIAAPDRTARFLSVWQGGAARLLHWVAQRRQRRMSINRLRHLNTWLLRDIRIDREDVEGAVDRLLSEQRFAMMGQIWNMRPDVEREWRVR